MRLIIDKSPCAWMAGYLITQGREMPADLLIILATAKSHVDGCTVCQRWLRSMWKAVVKRCALTTKTEDELRAEFKEHVKYCPDCDRSVWRMCQVGNDLFDDVKDAYERAAPVEGSDEGIPF